MMPHTLELEKQNKTKVLGMCSIHETGPNKKKKIYKPSRIRTPQLKKNNNNNWEGEYIS